MKRIFGEDYVNLVNVIQELLNEVGFLCCVICVTVE